MAGGCEPTISDDEILDAIRDADMPVLTTHEIVELLPIGGSSWNEITASSGATYTCQNVDTGTDVMVRGTYQGNTAVLVETTAET